MALQFFGGGSGGASVASLSNVFAAGVSLPASNGTDDTSTIQAVLTAHAGKRIGAVPGQVYKISAPLVISSGTTLDMTGATISLNAGSNCNLLTNAADTVQRTVSDGAITSGSNSLTSATAAFTTADTGRTVNVAGAATGGYLLTALMTYVNATTVTLTKLDGSTLSAGTTVSGAAVTIYNRDANIRVVGGTWARGSSAGVGTSQHSIRFRHVDGLALTGLTVTSSAGKYAMSLADLRNFRVEDVSFASASDGLHLMGPLSYGVASNLRGTSADDFVAITAQDWVAYADVIGDVTDVLIRNVATQSCLAAIKVLGGPAGAVKRVSIAGVRGAPLAGTTTGIWVGDDTGQASTVGGLIDDIRVSDVSLTMPSNRPPMLFNGTNMKSFEVDGLFYDDAAMGVFGVQIWPGSASTLDRAVIRNVSVGNLGTAAVVGTNSNVTIGTLVIAGVRVNATPNTTATSTVLADLSSSISNLRVADVAVRGSNGGYLVKVGATVTRATLTGLVHVATTNASHLLGLATAGATITDLNISDTHVNYASGYLLNLVSGVAVTATRVTLSNCHMVGGGGFCSALTSTQILPNLMLVNCVSSGTSWIADLNTTTDVDLSNVTNVAAANGSFNVRLNAVLRVRGSAGRVLGNPTIAAGGKLALVGVDFPPTTAVGGVPTVVAGAGAGTGATVTIAGTDRAGTVTVTTGTGPAAGTQAIVTFIGTWSTASPKVSITATNSAAASAALYRSASSSTAFTVSSVNAPGGSMTFDYSVIG